MDVEIFLGIMGDGTRVVVGTCGVRARGFGRNSGPDGSNGTTVVAVDDLSLGCTDDDVPLAADDGFATATAIFSTVDPADVGGIFSPGPASDADERDISSNLISGDVIILSKLLN
jgi:hypothetical protein